MRAQFLSGYLLLALLFLWSLITGNFEFLIYAAVTLALLGFLHCTDVRYQHHASVLWMFDIWIVLHILGGLLVVGPAVLYSFTLVPIIGEPYQILKYDQVVHLYCYFVIALLVYRIVKQITRPDISFTVLATIVVLTACGIGMLNEVVEFLAVVSLPQTNVGGYENTLLDIVANLLGALLALPFFRRYG